MSDIPTFACTICGEPSTEICVYCTKDSCENHLCVKCGRCSDCCECDLYAYRGRQGSGQPGRKHAAEDKGNEVPGHQNGEEHIHPAE